VVAIAFVGQLVHQITRGAFVDNSQTPTVALSQYDHRAATGRSSLPHDVHAFRIGTERFTVRRPAGWVLLEDEDALGRISLPPDNQLHVAFVTEVDATRIMNGDTPLFDKYVAIQSNRKLDANAITPKMFQEFKAGVRNQGFADAIPRNMRMINEFLSKKGQHVDEAKVIGFAEADDSYTLTVLVKQRGQDARVNTVTMRNLRGRCVIVGTTAVCRDQDDIKWSETTAAECAESME